ncbi:MAG: dipicolinate synthase subunit B [Clostridia bacterium]|nr:dipicolinate synthase subunit B [Clostridia bacterium]
MKGGVFTENDDRLKVGFAMTASFCTFSRVIPQMEKLLASGIDVIPIMSEKSATTDTRFGTAEDFIKRIKTITGKDVLTKETEVEPLGPKRMADALIIAPCSGATLARLASGLHENTVTLAAKSVLRNNSPVILAVSTNDGLSMSAKNIGVLLNSRNIYFVPFGQDDPGKKPRSLVADMDKILPTLSAAMAGRQIQPMLY